MANRTIIQLTEELSPQPSDLLIIQNSNLTKKIQAQNLIKPFIQDTSSVVQSNSANWQNTFTTVQANSAQWATDNSIDTDVRALTANWQDTFTNVQANSAQWAIDNSIDTEVRDLTANWQDTFTTVQSNSAQWGTDNSIDTEVRDLTANWQDTFTTVQSNSAQWATDNSIDTEVRDLTANWQDTFTTVQTNSADWKLADFIITCSDEISDLATSVSFFTFRAPFEMILDSVRASVTTAPLDSNIIVDVLQNSSSIFSTLLSIDDGENTSTTATTPAVISTPNITDDAEIVVAINQVGSTNPGTGLKLTFKGYRV